MVNAFGEATHGAVTIPVAREVIRILNNSNLSYAELTEVVDIINHELERTVRQSTVQLNISVREK